MLFLPSQHLMLALKVAIACAIPDVPSWVATEMAKIEYKRREIEKGGLASLGGSSANEDASTQTDVYKSPLYGGGAVSHVGRGLDVGDGGGSTRYYYYSSFGRPPRLIRGQRDSMS